MFQKLLIANRGEIAVRIIRACHEMGILTVAVFSEPDREALHVKMADEAVCIGSAAAKDSYLNMDRILNAALITNAQAIHPGFGFLSENDQFAEKCQDWGVVFVGPSSELIRKMGNKSVAKETMRQAGIPVIEGSKEPVFDNKEALRQAEKIGFPVMVKAPLEAGEKECGLSLRRVNLSPCFAWHSRKQYGLLEILPCTWKNIFRTQDTWKYRLSRTALAM